MTLVIRIILARSDGEVNEKDEEIILDAIKGLRHLIECKKLLVKFPLNTIHVIDAPKENDDDRRVLALHERLVSTELIRVNCHPRAVFK